jgi:uncharacterized protein YciI
MWQLQYVRAKELALERNREAQRARLARLHKEGRVASGPRFVGVRRGGAVAAAWVARHLDEAAAHDALSTRTLSEDPTAALS